MTHKSQMKGTVLLVTLFIMVVMVSLALMMTVRNQWLFSKVYMLFSYDRLMTGSQLVKWWAIRTLKETMPALKQNTVPDHLPVFSEIVLPNRLSVSGEITPLEGRFNVNQLIGPMPTVLFYRKIYGQILMHALSQTPSVNTTQLTTQLIDWLEKPYHYPMQLRSELKSVPGYSDAIYQKIAPFIVAMPPPTAFDMNAVSSDFLAAVADNLTKADIETFISVRESQNGFDRTMTLFTNPLIQKLRIPAEFLSVNSQYFLVTARVRDEKQSLMIYSLLRRDIHNRSIRVLWTSEGNW